MPVVAQHVTELQLQNAVLELASLKGWRVAHFRAARTQAGWRTPVSAQGVGFPDLVMCRRERLVIAELKSRRGTLTEDQQAWLDAFRAVNAEVWVLRPRDWFDGTIERILA